VFAYFSSAVISQWHLPVGVLDSKEIREQPHDDSDSFSEISQDSDTDINEASDPDAEINRPDLSDSGGNSDDGQADENGGSGGGDRSAYDDAADDDDDDVDYNEDRALWDKNDHDFCKIPFVPHLVTNYL
jgi:hypothetical protein